MGTSMSRRFMAVVVIVAGIGLVPTVVGGSPPPSAPPSPTVSTGTYDLLHEDPADRADHRPGRAASGPRAVVATADGPVTLPHVPDGPRPGDRVRVDHRSGAVDVLQRAVDPRAGDPRAAASEDVLVVPVQWSGNGPDGTTAASLTSVMAESSGWFDQVSGGRLGLSTTVRGWTTIGRPNGACADPTYDFAYDLRTRTATALRAAGTDPSAYDVVMIYFARTSAQTDCAWAGLGGGSSVWLAGYSDLGVVVHEIGHTLDLGHASRLRCTRAAAVVSLSSACTAIEYGDPTDIMGTSDAGFAAPHLDRLGWLAAAERRVLSVPTAGTTSTSSTLRPLARPGTGLRTIRVDHPDGSAFWIENRRRVGVDATRFPAAHQGVIVHLALADDVEVPCEGQISGCAGTSFVIDARPTDASPESVAVDPATGWRSPDGTVQIDVTGTSGDDVTVAVLLTAPTAAPPAITSVDIGRDGTVVRWTGAGTGAIGDPATAYRVFVVEYAWWSSVEVAADARSARVPTPSGGYGEKVTIRVVGANAMGPGVPSTPTRPRHVGGQAPFATWDDMVTTLRTTFTGSPGSWNDQWDDIEALDSGATAPARYVADLVAHPHFEPRVAPVARLYRAYYRRLPDHSGLTYWAGRLRAGRSLTWVSESFSRAPEFVRTYGSLTDRQFVDLVYRNVLGRAPDQAGSDYWTGQLTSGRRNRGQVMIGFSQSPENVRATAPSVDAVMVYAGLLGRAPTTAEIEAAAGLSRAQLAARILTGRELEDRVG